jgi:hypothetical protein
LGRPVEGTENIHEKWYITQVDESGKCKNLSI